MATKKSTETKKATKKATAEKKPKASLGAKKTVAKKAVKAKAKKASSKVKLTPEQLFVKTQELAYFLAEKDGFSRNPTHYWLDAETEVARQN
ncbi:MAG: DUF2934 domain-containing protein [Verrucomicrobiales bacterium]|nr:DUF2934 domain-containing protein [Verrucomicrobiae bacterium]